MSAEVTTNTDPKRGQVFTAVAHLTDDLVGVYQIASGFVSQREDADRRVVGTCLWVLTAGTVQDGWWTCSFKVGSITPLGPVVEGIRDVKDPFRHQQFASTLFDEDSTFQPLQFTVIRSK